MIPPEVTVYDQVHCRTSYDMAPTALQWQPHTTVHRGYRQGSGSAQPHGCRALPLFDVGYMNRRAIQQLEAFKPP